MKPTDINTLPLFKSHEADISHHVVIGPTRAGMSAPLFKMTDEYARMGGKIIILDKGPSK